MKNSSRSRRQFLRNTAAGAGLLSLPGLLSAHVKSQAEKKKIVCVGAHPDDPESGCGGALALLAKAGHEVTVIYVTSGERGIKGKTWDEAGAIRKQEGINACAVLNAKPVFAGEINGNIIVNYDWMDKIQQLIEAEQPDIVFSHWPVDTHEDHQASSMMVSQAWRKAKTKFTLYFFEVCTGEQSMIFHPTDYIDITETQEIKRKAVYCHVSQDPPGIYDCGHTSMEDFRGRELGVKAAEAFVRLNGRRQGGLQF
jgi:LmbE family N-acetylglucosaminyl deacetylase